MKILLSTICDRAQHASDGRLHIEGQYFDLYAPGFPAKHDFNFLAVLEWDRADHGRYNFVVELQDPLGKPCLRGEGHTEVVDPGPDGPAARTYYIEPLTDVVFPVPGEYRFRVQVKGRWYEGPSLYLWESGEAANGSEGAQA